VYFGGENMKRGQKSEKMQKEGRQRIPGERMWKG
jgi:hypothetical protein